MDELVRGGVPPWPRDPSTGSPVLATIRLRACARLDNGVAVIILVKSSSRIESASSRVAGSFGTSSLHSSCRSDWRINTGMRHGECVARPSNLSSTSTLDLERAFRYPRCITWSRRYVCTWRGLCRPPRRKVTAGSRNDGPNSAITEARTPRGFGIRL
jgi:hypothetical protein